MKEKLVEEWLIKARERGGVDQAFGQWLISQGHQILWLGHSRTEFGKDIVTEDSEGHFHAFQTKNEDIGLNELRRINAQITELVEVPIVHPRVPAGSHHFPHLVTSGLFKEEAVARIRAMNEGWKSRAFATLDIVSRNDLIPRFVGMSDAFWPERPADIRDFLTFYLADGRGDFEPQKFSGTLKGLLSLEDEPTSRKRQRLAAVGLLANYLLNPFEREGDHWNLFVGWTVVAAHQAWFAARSNLPETDWKPSFALAKEAAKEQLVTLSIEALQPRGFEPGDKEFDDYTRAKNLVLAGVLALTGLIGSSSEVDQLKITTRLEMLLRDDRLFAWGESAIPFLIMIQWYAEKNGMSVDAMFAIKAVIVAICERNQIRCDDEAFPPPLISADEVLAKLFKDQPSVEPNRKAPGAWSLEGLIDFLARRNHRDFLADIWRAASRLDLMSFQAEPLSDSLLWKASEGHEAVRKLEMEQSWKILVETAQEDRSHLLSPILKNDRDFALMFSLSYPHRFSRALVGTLDKAIDAGTYS